MMSASLKGLALVAALLLPFSASHILPVVVIWTPN